MNVLLVKALSAHRSKTGSCSVSVSFYRRIEVPDAAMLLIKKGRRFWLEIAVDGRSAPEYVDEVIFSVPHGKAEAEIEIWLKEMVLDAKYLILQGLVLEKSRKGREWMKAGDTALRDWQEKLLAQGWKENRD